MGLGACARARVCVCVFVDAELIHARHALFANFVQSIKNPCIKEPAYWPTRRVDCRKTGTECTSAALRRWPMARSWRQFIQRSGSFPLNLLTELTAVFDMGGATYCSVVGCSARISHNKGLTYHNVPKKGIGKDQWRAELLRKINRAGKSFNPDKARICSRHFTEDCFKYGEYTGCFVVRAS